MTGVVEYELFDGPLDGLRVAMPYGPAEWHFPFSRAAKWVDPGQPLDLSIRSGEYIYDDINCVVNGVRRLYFRECRWNR